jgi:hypothetical protein
MATRFDIIITVPHAQQPVGGDRDRHLYDFVASEFAGQLRTAIVGRGINATVNEFHVSRDVVDGNRAWARHHSWRETINRSVLVQKNAGRPVMVIDVHSYPADYVGFDGLDMVFVAPARPREWYGMLARILAEQHGIRVGIAVSPSMSDIVREYSCLNIPSLMIEVSEGATIDRASAATNLAYRISEFWAARDRDIYEACRGPLLPIPPIDPGTHAPDNLKSYFVDALSPNARVKLFFNTVMPNDVICPYCKKQATGDAPFMMCHACQSVAYCSEEHQKADWEHGRHWEICNLLDPVLNMHEVPRGRAGPRAYQVGGQHHHHTGCIGCSGVRTFHCSKCNAGFCETCVSGAPWREHVCQTTSPLQEGKGKGNF